MRLPNALSVDGLRWAWRESRDATSNPGAPGVDGVRAAAFASELADNIHRIRQKVRAGTYRFSRLRLARLLKEPGKYRVLGIPTVRDRLLQRALLWHLESSPKFQPASDIAYGFIKQRTLPDAQRRALALRNSHPWVLKCDIVQFFDRIQREQLKELVRRRVTWKVVAELLCQAVDTELQIQSAEDALLLTESGIKSGRGLRQGMPISPMLSNLLLKRFDERLQTRGVIAVRYADDIAVFGADQQACKEAFELIEEGLAPLGLTVPHYSAGGKTRLLSPSEPAEFLGVEIRRFEEGYRLRPPKGRLDAIETAMAGMVSLQHCLAKKRNVGQVIRLLDSCVIGHAASMAVLKDGGNFRGRLEAIKARQLNRLLIEVLGAEAVKGLDEARLAVLGLGPFPEFMPSIASEVPSPLSPTTA